MTEKKHSSRLADVKALLAEEPDVMKALVKEALQEVLDAEMTEFLGADRSERSAGRTGYRSGYYSRGLVTRIGKLELRVPRDRNGEFSTALFERYQRSEKALVAALAEMYVQGVSTRKVTAITEELCGHRFSASSISAINKGMDEALARFAGRPLDEVYPYLILDARYEKVREDGVIRSQAVLIAIGINWEGQRQVLAVELANRESATSWKGFLMTLKQRGLHGVEFVVSDDHAGLKRAIGEISRRRPGSAVTCTFCATRWTICRAKLTTTACRSCAGSMTGGTSRRQTGTWRHGLANGRGNTQSWPTGSKGASARR
jgi:transposase-like protein